MEYDLEFLRRKLNSFKPMVRKRYLYYDSKFMEGDFGITIPPYIRQMYRSSLGWCAKAVDSLADRLVFKDFSNDLFGLNEIFNLNNPDIFFDSAILSALISSCCFIYISMGNEGYPRLQIIEGSEATGVIDPITGLLKVGYAVLDKTENGNPKTEVIFLPDRTEYYLEGKLYSSVKNPAGIPLLVPIIYRPDAVLSVEVG